MSARGGTRILALAAMAALGGCDTGGGGGGAAPGPGAGAMAGAVRVAADGFGAYRRVLGGLSSDETVSAPRAVPGGFEPEAIAADLGAYRYVEINALGIAGPARVIQENGPEITLALQSGPTVAFDAGILTATRGLGEDIHAIDAPGLLGLLRAGSGSLTRRIESLDDQDQVVTDAFACTVTSAGTENVDLGLRQVALSRREESCRGDRLGFDNVYWLDGAGTVVASLQFVSVSVAYLRAAEL